MGLNVSVGQFAGLLKLDQEGAAWAAEDFEVVNELLAANGLPPHVEPTSLPRLHNRCVCPDLFYSDLHYLRRAYAHWKRDPRWLTTPVADDEDPTDDPILIEELERAESHLVCHSDCEGYYLPIDFQELLVDESGRLAGGIVGSSYRLRDELIYMAPALNLVLQDGILSDEQARELNAEHDNPSELHRERLTWLTMYEAARLSIEHKSAICFG
jgi:hypothetical protein